MCIEVIVYNVIVVFLDTVYKTSHLKTSPRTVVWHYSTFIRFDTILKCDRHTQTDGQTHDDGIYRT